MSIPLATNANELSPVWMLPFAAQVMAIAILPLSAPHWWKHQRHKGLVSLLLSIPILFMLPWYDLAAFDLIMQTAHDYLVFILLLSALYVAAGGIYIKLSGVATSIANTLLLILGAIAASLVGTTGAAMVFLRPLIRVNRNRQHRVHTVMFFIFLVGNIGGCLTPLGDPPMLLGFLYGVPFTWTLNLWPAWLFSVALLSMLYLAIDRYLIAREQPRARKPAETHTRFAVEGKIHFLWITGILTTVAAAPSSPYLEIMLALLLLFSVLSSSTKIHRANEYHWAPIIEVAVVFAGIFVTMIPALQILKQYGHQLGLHSPFQFFWVTGLVSAILDNAPTYAVFFNIAKSSPLPNPIAGVPESLLSAISLGAVFFGACTYISNAPNLMIRAIAEHAGIRMPSFFAHLGYSILILLPIFVLLAELVF